MEQQTIATSGPGQQEVRLTGRSIAPGLGMARAWVVGDALRSDGVPQTISAEAVDRECDRLVHSFAEAFAELDESARRIESEFDSALAGIFRAHGTILRGLVDSGEFERAIRTSSLTGDGPRRAERRLLFDGEARHASGR